MIDIRRALEQGLLQLDTSEARLEVELLLAFVLNKNRAYLYAHPEKILDSVDLERYLDYVQQRSTGKPIAYITGQRSFWSLDLQVNEHTLIPRHETERLVELVLELMPDENNTRLLDLGTGSGAIALAVAKERPNWLIDACDKSIAALQVARTNTKRNHIDNVNFYESDWFNQLPKQKYQIIVANPPYIHPQDPHLHEGDLQFEPQNALVSSQEGLADLQYIIEHAQNWLLPDGLLLLEHGFQQKAQIETILNRLSYREVHCWQDVQGRDRVSGGWRPK